jgi:RinA family phage transcriptional activator
VNGVLAKTDFRKYIFKYVEYELYNYDASKSRLTEIRGDILRDLPRDVPRDEYTSRGLPGSPTENKAVALTTNSAIAHIERTIAAIDTARRMMNQDQRTLCDEKYRQGKPWRRICREQYWSESKYHRIRNKVVQKTAECMGFWLPAEKS